MTYCDSSFLTALYLRLDKFNPLARREASRFTSAIPYTSLNELEFLNTLRRGLGEKTLTNTDYDLIVREIKVDELDGLIGRSTLNQIKLHEKALELSKKHTSALACRSLDILHVASALILGAQKFASFDVRQRKLAEAVRLSLVPLILSK